MFESHLRDLRKGVDTCLRMKRPPATVRIKQWQAAYLGLPTNMPVPDPSNEVNGDNLVKVKLYMLYEKLREAKSVEQRNDQAIG